MKKETSLCMGCMAKLENTGEHCAVCGYTGDGVFLASYLVPTTFLAERYVIGKLISYNGEGALYIAYDTENDMKVTVREYMPDTLCGRKKDEEAVEVNPQYVALYKTYLSEFIELNRSLMEAGKSLRVQRVLNVFTENNTAYVVCEYITGISLKTYLSNLGGVLPWEQVGELFTPLFTTLDAIHDKGIVHRGISPSTILLNDRSELILINFGITASRTFGSEINYEVFTGYAAPEQYSGVARHGSWTDVYGMAAVLYKVLTGQLPPSASKRAEDRSGANITEPMLINRNIPASVSAAIMRAMTLDIDARTGKVGDLAGGLFEAAPISVPDDTNEILIKKPRKSVADEAEAPRTRQVPISSKSRMSKSKKKSTSNAAAITVCVMLGLVLATFVTVIVLATNTDLFDDLLSSGDPPQTSPPTTHEPPPLHTPPPDTTTPPTGGNSSGEALFTVRDYTGRVFENLQYNFLVFTPEYLFNDEYKAGEIFWQSIPDGTMVSDGTEIEVKVSKGPEAVALPDYTDKNYADYAKELFELGIIGTASKEEDDYNETVPAGIVTRCSVEIGAKVSIANGDTVMIYYSKGPDPNAYSDYDPQYDPNFDPLTGQYNYD